MKKAFTLVELLVVVVVIVTLMAITFRLAGVAGSSNNRNITIERMQRIENALSGYYAAFGSYPPVDLHAKRNVYLRADLITGDQEDAEDSELKWENVRAACRAQPFSARFPFAKDMHDYVKAVSDIVVQRANSSDSRYKEYQDREILKQGFTALDDFNGLSGVEDESSWQAIKIFQFGVMSFLMPRYMFMLTGVEDLSDLDRCAQWKASNRYSANPNNGMTFSSWQNQLRYKSLIRRFPSQAVCARWMPNFEGIVNCTGSPEFFGVKVSNGSGGSLSAESSDIEVFKNGGMNYVLDCMTIYDGWHQEFYYYSPAPFQSYRLWSAGPDGKTFPPWVPLDSIKNESDKRTAAGWMADDIMFMSN